MEPCNLQFRLLCFITLTLILFGCANPVTPTGGPKDIRPPEVLACEPPNFSTGFREKSFRIIFDEFVNLKNTSTEVTISPPLSEAPDFRLRGKSLIVQLNDSLRANTTYIFNFGKCISDLTESNPLADFSYVFSTGTSIDSLSLEGKVISAFNLTPQKEISLLLYLDNNDTIPFDSLPFRIKPYYLARSGEDGKFRFRNLMNRKMKLIALKDLNGNNFYDQPSELIGFADSLILPVYIKPVVNDTSVIADTTANEVMATDTVRDTLQVNTIRLFEQIDSAQAIAKTAIPTPGCLKILLRFPSINPRLVPLTEDSIPEGILSELNSRKDTLTFWFTGKVPDTLKAVLTEPDQIIDTLELSLRPPGKKKKGEKEDDLPVLQISSPGKTGTFNQFTGNFTIECGFPLRSWDFSRILLIQEKDTTFPGGSMADSINRTIIIPFAWKEGKSYRLIIPDSTFISLNGSSHDTIRHDFKTRLQKEFGSLILTVRELPGPLIIQLLTEKEDIIIEKYITRPEQLRFEYLRPSRYKIKAVFDINKNSRWDTGNLGLKLQPEKVFYLPKTIELRANWEVEEFWSVEE